MFLTALCVCVTGEPAAAGDDAFTERADAGSEPSLWYVPTVFIVLFHAAVIFVQKSRDATQENTTCVQFSAVNAPCS